MTMSGYRWLVIGACLGLVILAGCDKRADESKSQNRPASRSLRDQRPSSVSSRTAQDDSLYRQILETMQQENKALKQQIQETVEKYAELETLLNEIKLERDVAFKAYLKVSQSIESLKADAGAKDRRINELEQANEA